jgi:hypothetical protein
LARFQSQVKTKITQDIGLTHVPAVKAIRPGTMSKTAKIEALDVRFTHHLVKLPIYRRAEGRWWSRFFDQIEGFNPEAADGGLEKDDEIDVFSMSLFILKSRVRELKAPPPIKPIDPIEHARNGHLTMEGGASTLSLIPLDMLTSDDLNTILERRHLPAGPSSKV